MEFNPNLRITRKADRVEAAKSFEDNEGFREYVMDILEKRVSESPESEEFKIMESLSYTSTDEEFVFKLCQMGYIIYTDFLMDAYAGFEKKHLH
tara:strand:+ start:1162 stop:1443 length:282 start_codon:yes stop_codon:yes gene_type:complete